MLHVPPDDNRATAATQTPPTQVAGSTDATFAGRPYSSVFVRERRAKMSETNSVWMPLSQPGCNNRATMRRSVDARGYVAPQKCWYISPRTARLALHHWNTFTEHILLNLAMDQQKPRNSLPHTEFQWAPWLQLFYMEIRANCAIMLQSKQGGQLARYTAQWNEDLAAPYDDKWCANPQFYFKQVTNYSQLILMDAFLKYPSFWFFFASFFITLQHGLIEGKWRENVN